MGATVAGMLAPLAYTGIVEGYPVVVSLYEETGFTVEYFGNRALNWASRDLFLALRYSLRNVLTWEKLAQLEQMAEKYRDINKFYKEVKKYNDLFDAIKKVMK